MWKIGDDKIEEVKTFKYLGFVFQSNGRFKSHINEMTSAAKRATAQTWSIGQRRFRDNFSIRKQMFKSLVLPAMTYGCEITGWVERSELEAQHRKYYRWTLGLNRGTRKAILYEETDTSPIHIVTGNRAMKFEEKGRFSACMALRACIAERLAGAKLVTGEDRGSYCRGGGWSEASINEALRRGDKVSDQLRDRHIEIFLQLKEVKIDQLRYASIRPSHNLPAYLQHRKDIATIARFRCENEEWGRERWRRDRGCRVCNGEEETLEHQTEECCKWITSVKGLLNERGCGLDRMKRIIECRRMN